ncbi:uncharacterized protein LOC122266759 isoform X2 [Penaeus japonicus]|uniref:uncharacterized protein LOC122266759 isoform X2 n=1 Tax=Penaeus japonicus TaxID=27405 RepID=UPI001C714CA3|nr:uncharacterized protein LOC122266759 isoform X2 [Penaeus japonicus]
MRLILATLLLAATAFVVADALPTDDTRDPRQVEFSFTFDDDDEKEESGRGFGDSFEADGFYSDGRPRARRPVRRPHRFRRPFAGGARPFRPQRESIGQNSLEDDFGPGFVGSGGPVRGNVYRGREEGVMGFLESFRRLIRRMI